MASSILENSAVFCWPTKHSLQSHSKTSKNWTASSFQASQDATERCQDEILIASVYISNSAPSEDAMSNLDLLFQDRCISNCRRVNSSWDHRTMCTMIFSCGESRRCKNHSAFNGKSNRFAADRFAAAVEPRRERGGAQRSFICPRPLLSWRSLAWIAFICLNLPHLTINQHRSFRAHRHTDQECPEQHYCDELVLCSRTRDAVAVYTNTYTNNHCQLPSPQ